MEWGNDQLATLFIEYIKLLNDSVRQMITLNTGLILIIAAMLERVFIKPRFKLFAVTSIVCITVKV